MQVTKTLIDSGLGHLSLSQQQDSFYLQNIYSLLDKDGDKFPTLRQGFKDLVSFELLYRGMIQHRIRKHLDVL